jgi:hypothetical protein
VKFQEGTRRHSIRLGIVSWLSFCEMARYHGLRMPSISFFAVFWDGHSRLAAGQFRVHQENGEVDDEIH